MDNAMITEMIMFWTLLHVIYMHIGRARVLDIYIEREREIQI
tara:strand:- start:239 stop:364 length:126 start_codon:yes stop_codon:yes gene_type:complete